MFSVALKAKKAHEGGVSQCAPPPPFFQCNIDLPITSNAPRSAKTGKGGIKRMPQQVPRSSSFHLLLLILLKQRNRGQMANMCLMYAYCRPPPPSHVCLSFPLAHVHFGQ